MFNRSSYLWEHNQNKWMTTQEYNSCVDQYSDGVYRFILKNIKDADKAKDIVQEAFVRLWNKVEEVNFEKSKSYLFTTAYHCFINVIRYEKKITPMEEHHTDSRSTQNSYSDLKDVINEAVDKLPEIQRTVILLRDYEGYSYKEIGEITELNESQVKVYIYRARVYLKNYLVNMDVLV